MNLFSHIFDLQKIQLWFMIQGIMSRQMAIFSFLLLCSSLSLAQWPNAPLKIPAPRPILYPTDANAKQEIAQTIVQAGKENKRVILVFGANWCGDCYALDYAFHRPSISPLLDANFKVVHVDIGENDKNLDLAKKYQIDPEKGIPALAVLAPNGNLLHSTKEFDRARAMTEQDVIQFLNTWKTQAAEQSQSK